MSVTFEIKAVFVLVLAAPVLGGCGAAGGGAAQPTSSPSTDPGAGMLLTIDVTVSAQ